MSKNLEWIKQDKPPRWVPYLKNHTCTLVHDEMFIIGGYDGRMNHNKIYVFNLNTQGWYSIQDANGTLPNSRNGHSATFVERLNTIFIMGGWLGRGPLAADDLFAFDVDTHTWSTPVTTGDSPGACNMHTTDYVETVHKLFVFRGGDGMQYLNDLHTLDLKSMHWEKPQTKGIPPKQRANHASAVVNNKLYIFGGWDGKQRLSDLNVLDINTMTWDQPKVFGSVPSARAGMSFTLVGNRIYLFGGSGQKLLCFNDLQVFDTDTNTWLNVWSEEKQNEEEEEQEQEDIDVNTNAINNTQITSNKPLLPANNMMTANPNSDPEMPLLKYDEENSSINNIPNLALKGSIPAKRAGHSATRYGRCIYIFGGSYGTDYLDDFTKLDTDPLPIVKVTHETPIKAFQTSLKDFLFSEDLSDITLIVENKKIHAHRIVLSLFSERFRALLLSGFKEMNETEIHLPDVRYDLFIQILEFCYTGESSLINSLKLKIQNVKTNPNGGGSSTSTMPGILAANLMYKEENSQLGEQQVSINDNNERFHNIKSFTSTTTGEDEKVEIFDLLNINEIEYQKLVELLQVSDQFLIDHLKQLCESILKDLVNDDTVHSLLELSQMNHALQLQSYCEHFIRNSNELLLNQKISPTSSTATPFDNNASDLKTL